MTDPCDNETCPVARAMQILDGKWTVLVVRDLLQGTRRFSELRTSLQGVSPKTLTDRLRVLEAHGLVRRTVFAEVPPRVEYQLTDRGRGLEPVLDALSRWSAESIPQPRARRTRSVTAVTPKATS
ncbi:MAG: helix-turn-helix domain-containing protein [Actinomycetota bacterium]